MTVNNIHAASNDLINKAIERERLEAAKNPVVEVLWRCTMNHLTNFDYEERNRQLLKHYYNLTGKSWNYLCTIEQAIETLDSLVSKFIIDYSNGEA